MTNKIPSSDYSFHYHENSFVDNARMDSSMVYGNLADAMKNSTVVLSPTQIIETKIISSPKEVRNVTIDNSSESII